MIETKFINLARTAIVSAEDVLRKYFGASPEKLEAVIKADGTVRTIADVESERMIKKVLAPLAGTCSFQGEELGKSGEAKAYSIFVDPLDGTSNYYRARSDFGICIALVDKRLKNRQVVSVAVY